MPSSTPQLGILFVHGIGQQKQGETLVKFADPLTRWLARWLTRGQHTEAYVGPPDGARVRVSEANLGGDNPAHLYVEIDGGTDIPQAGQQRWLLAESWWAETFQPPKTRSLLLWMLGILPYMLLVQFYEQFKRARRPAEPGGWRRLARAGRICAFLLLYISALPLAAVMAAVIAVLLVGLIVPIPTVSDYAKKAALKLSSSLGDSFVLASSAVQFDAMVARVAADLTWLSKEVQHVVVVAHSQGTAVSYAAISGYANPSNLEGFITVGEAIKKLHLVRRLQTYGDSRDRVELKGLRASDEPWWERFKRTAIRWFRLKSLRFLFGWLGLAGFLLVSFSIPQLLVVGGQQHTHLLLGSLIAAAGIGLIVLVLMICDKAWKEDFTDEPRQIPHGNGNLRWADFYASADPVPNGPLFDPDKKFDPATDRAARADWLVEKEVWNFASIVRDHTSYTSSEDDFLGCMIAELFRAARVTLPAEEVALLHRARWRGWWRVWWLTFARIVAAIAAVVTLYRVWSNISHIGRRMIDWSHHTGPLKTVGKHVVDGLQKLIVVGHIDNVELVGLLTVFAVVAGGYLTVAASWAYWQKQDIERFYRRRDAEENTDPLGGRELLLFLMVLTALVFVAVVVVITRDYTLPWTWVKEIGSYWLLLLPGVLLVPVILSWALRTKMVGWETELMAKTPRDRLTGQPDDGGGGGAAESAEGVHAPAVPAN